METQAVMAVLGIAGFALTIVSVAISTGKILEKIANLEESIHEIRRTVEVHDRLIGDLQVRQGVTETLVKVHLTPPPKEVRS